MEARCAEPIKPASGFCSSAALLLPAYQPAGQKSSLCSVPVGEPLSCAFSCCPPF